MTHSPPRIASEIVGSFNNDKHAHGKMEGMEIYQSKYSRLGGTSYNELERKVRKLHNTIAKRTKRNAYLRSAYFDKDKIFLTLFWTHLNQNLAEIANDDCATTNARSTYYFILHTDPKHSQTRTARMNLSIDLLALPKIKSYSMCRSKRMCALATNISCRYFPPSEHHG